MSEILEQEPQKVKRPVLITVLAILSFINIGWSIINNLISLARGPMSQEEMEEFKVEITKNINEMRNTGGMDWMEDFMRSIINMVEVTNSNHVLNVLSSTLILFVGLAGVIFMMKGKKLGFHAYIVYSFLASVQIYLFVAPSLLSNTIVILSLILSGIFIVLYGLNLKWMNK